MLLELFLQSLLLDKEQVMLYKLFAGCAVVILALSPMRCLAEQRPTVDDAKSAAKFNLIDRNGDGAIDRAEFDYSKRVRPSGYDIERPTVPSPRGMLTLESARSSFSATFAKLDLNSDGVIQLEEFPPAMEPDEPVDNTANRASYFAMHDLNGSGQITEDEFVRFNEDKFRKRDMDGNGIYDQNDLAIRKRQIADRKARDTDKAGH